MLSGMGGGLANVRRNCVQRHYGGYAQPLWATDRQPWPLAHQVKSSVFYKDPADYLNS